MSDDLITIFEAAQRFGVRESTMETWVRQGRIAVVRLGPKTLRVKASEVERVILRATIPACLGGSAELYARVHKRFKRLFMQQGIGEIEAEEMASVATRDR